MNRKELYQYIKDQQSNICQISVLQNGNVIYCAEWNGYQRTDCTHIMSATKSIVSLLVGIAIDHERIGSVDDKVLSYFSEYSVKRGEKTIYDVTIKQLLTMRAAYKGHCDPWTKVCSSENWTTASLDFLGGRKGIEFNYRTVCLYILSGILYIATGMKTVDFANQYLFLPLGIQKHKNYYAETAADHKQFTMDKLPRKNVWFCDPQGLGTPGYGLCMSAADMAKIGQLCLQKWIKEILIPKPVMDNRFRGMSYGYLWWIVHPEKNIYAAIGNSGNVIYVDPNRKIVAAVSAYFKPTVFDRIGFIEEVLLPALQSFSGSIYDQC